MRSEYLPYIYDLLTEGQDLIDSPEKPRALFLHNTRLILKEYGIRDDDNLLTIVNLLQKIYNDEVNDSRLPPLEILENAALEMDAAREKVQQTQQNASQAQKEFEKRAAQAKPPEKVVYEPPVPTVTPEPILPKEIREKVSSILEKTPQAATAYPFIEQIIAQQIAIPPEERVKTNILQENLKTILQQQTGLEPKQIQTLIAPVVVIPLAEMAKEAAAAKTQVPTDIKAGLEEQIQKILVEQHPTLPETTILPTTEKITEAFVRNYSEPNPQKTQALSGVVETILQEAGVVFVKKEQLTDLIQQIQSSSPAQTVQKYFETLPNIQEVVAKPEMPQDLPTLQAKFEETVAMVFGDEPKLKGLPKETVKKVGQKTTEVLTAQILSPKGWEQDPAIQAVKQAMENEGVGLTPAETKTLVGKVEQTAQKLQIISALERIEKPLPEEIFTKLGTEPLRVSPMARFKATVEHIISTPAAGAIINTKNKTPEWQDIAEGRFGERYLESAKVLVSAGMPKTHPTIVKLEEKGQRLLKVQQENGRDKPVVTILKHYHSLSQLTKKARIFDKELGIYLPQLLTPRIAVFRISLETRFVTFLSGGRFASFGSIQTAIYQKSFGRVISALSKSKLGKGISAAVAKKLGVQVASKIATAAGAAAVGTAVAPGVGTAIGFVVGFIPDAISFIKKKFKDLGPKLAGALVAGGMMLGGLGTLVMGGPALLGGGLLALGAGSLAAMAPGLGVSLGGAASGMASGAASLISAITTGSVAGAPIAAGVTVGAGSIGFLAFIIIMIASGAFILPTNGGGMQFPWTGSSSSCPAQFPTIAPPSPLPFYWPVDNSHTCSSPFGNHNDPFSPTECNCHTGIDIPGPTNCTNSNVNILIHAVADGTIYKIFYSENQLELGAYGNYIIIDHGGGLFSLYGHLKSIATELGKHVSKGAIIGFMGTTGHSTGCHLHLGFSDCGSIELGCFSQGEHTPAPCDYLSNCDNSCTFKDVANGCPTNPAP